MKNKIYFVIGASGSGKTTTLKRFEKAIPLDKETRSICTPAPAN